MMSTYEKILNMKIALRDVSDAFRPYSASDIKRIVASKRDSHDMLQLYELERLISEVRVELIETRRRERELRDQLASQTS